MRFVEVEPGVPIFVQDLGHGDPVVLIPGFGMTHEVWDRQVRTLTGAGHRVICIDQRGHGQSGKPLEGYEVDRLARDVLAVLRVLRIDNFALVGFSFGGQVAFHVAATQAHRVTKLVLVGSNAVRASRSNAFPFGAEPGPTVRAMVEMESADRFAARRVTIRGAFASEPEPTVFDWITRQFLAMPSWAAIACYHSMLETDLMADMVAINMPVLLLIGDSDPLHSARGSHWLCSQLADATLVELANCGHFPMFEAPDEFDSQLLDFLTPSERAAPEHTATQP